MLLLGQYKGLYSLLPKSWLTRKPPTLTSVVWWKSCPHFTAEELY